MPKTALAAAAAFALTIMPAAAQERPAYGAQLEGYDYPFEVGRFAFTSQGQEMTMAYMDVAPEGKANGRVAVLLHGKNFCGATWKQTIDTLSREGYRVVAPDQIGFCKSTKPTGYQFSFNQLAANTKALLESLGIEEATVIGHSMGGMLAARYALAYPSAVEQLVMVNPIGLEDWQAEGVPYATIDTAYQGELKTSFETIKAYQQDFYYNGDWKAEYDAPVEMLAGMYAGAGRDIVAWNQAQTSDMVFTQPVVHEFPNIAVKTTLMIGGLDRTAPGAARASDEVKKRLGNYTELGKRTAQAIPNAELIAFPKLGHSPQVEAPGEFHEKLIAALKR